MDSAQAGPGPGWPVSFSIPVSCWSTLSPMIPAPKMTILSPGLGSGMLYHEGMAEVCPQWIQLKQVQVLGGLYGSIGQRRYTWARP